MLRARRSLAALEPLHRSAPSLLPRLPTPTHFAAILSEHLPPRHRPLPPSFGIQLHPRNGYYLTSWHGMIRTYRCAQSGRSHRHRTGNFSSDPASSAHME
ncbi:hypothetical protein Mp_1g21670 [Marchantia polymorpha subsp. ruderalis]|uniref:Uncharacterized protein n=2 Tax=Marchantia polymorpha TaxID=3197 RepID=A0AAF6ASS8_MARPO|nr:hypothetical protein MARPO_0001s0502 [Marchantia polymorpha]BBM99498.1 hypothetical protein Mp_1g21670 [Marchantia polymorpha subsp. ruderalis]|eukprot:PTQ50580.1 hypothetical protein MARPO_0001s0502 [Marchantia polymorpha]